jgi:hypothetical protein
MENLALILVVDILVEILDLVKDLYQDMVVHHPQNNKQFIPKPNNKI